MNLLFGISTDCVAQSDKLCEWAVEEIIKRHHKTG